MSVERAIPVALLVNELVTNAAKRAYKSAAPCAIDVRVAREGRRVQLSVRDGGIGASPEDPNTAKDLGTRFISAFVRQLTAQIRFDVDGTGTTVALAIPIADPRANDASR
jgi:two-component sensor histidine kinase